MILTIVTWLLLTPIVVIFLKYIRHLLTLHRYPPGPFPLPLLGNLHLLTDKPYLGLQKLVKKYGDVFSFSMGFKRVVVISSYDAAKEALVTKSCSGRPTDNFLLKVGSRNFANLAFGDYGSMWTKTRRLAHLSLKDYGSLEHKV